MSGEPLLQRARRTPALRHRADRRPRPARRVVRRGRRHDGRPRRPVRLGQDHPAQRHRRPGPPGRRHRASSTAPTSPRSTRTACPGCGARRSSYVFQTLRADPGAVGRGERRRPAAAGPRRRRPSASGGSSCCWSWSAWPTTPSSGRASCPAASSSGWRSPARWPPRPGCCIADEPTGQLDAETGLSVMALLRGGGGVRGRHRAGVHPRPGDDGAGRPGDPHPRRAARRNRQPGSRTSACRTRVTRVLRLLAAAPARSGRCWPRCSASSRSARRCWAPAPCWSPAPPSGRWRSPRPAPPPTDVDVTAYTGTVEGRGRAVRRRRHPRRADLRARTVPGDHVRARVVRAAGAAAGLAGTGTTVAAAGVSVGAGRPAGPRRAGRRALAAAPRRRGAAGGRRARAHRAAARPGLGSRVRLGAELAHAPAPPIDVTVVGVVRPLPGAGWDRDPLAAAGYDLGYRDGRLPAAGQRVRAVHRRPRRPARRRRHHRPAGGHRPPGPVPRPPPRPRHRRRGRRRRRPPAGRRARRPGRRSNGSPPGCRRPCGPPTTSSRSPPPPCSPSPCSAVVLTATALALAGRLTAGVRADETALLSALGISRGQLAAAATVEAGALAVARRRAGDPGLVRPARRPDPPAAAGGRRARPPARP